MAPKYFLKPQFDEIFLNLHRNYRGVDVSQGIINIYIEDQFKLEYDFRKHFTPLFDGSGALASKQRDGSISGIGATKGKSLLFKSNPGLSSKHQAPCSLHIQLEYPIICSTFSFFHDQILYKC